MIYQQLPYSTQKFLSSLMEEKIKNHPSDWSVSFKSEYGKRFYNLSEQEDSAQRATEEQERIRKELEEYEKQQELQKFSDEEREMLKRAQKELEQATKAQIGIGKGRSAGGYGSGAPGRSDELKAPSIGEITLGDSSGSAELIPILALVGKAAQFATDSGLGKVVQKVSQTTGIGGLKGYTIVRDPQTRREVFVNTKTGQRYRDFSELPLKDQASFRAGQGLMGIGKALGNAINDIGGYDYVVGTIGEMGRKHIRDVISGGGHNVFYLPNRPRDPNDYFRASAIAQQEP